jgi:hypothetical protein
MKTTITFKIDLKHTLMLDAFFLFSIEKNLENLKKNLEKRNPVN